MWFTQDDQKRGTVGDARLKEIVQEIVLRVDPKELNQQDLERKSSNLIASIAKHFKYKKQEQFDPSSARDNPEILKMQNHIRFVNGCYQANEELLAFEGMLMQIKHEAQTKAIQALEQRLAAAREQKVAADTSIQQQLDKIKQLEMQMLMDQKAYHEKMLQDLLNYRSHLDNQLKFLAAQLIHSRVETAKEVKSELGKMPELADLSDQQMSELSNGLVLLAEKKAVEIAKIDRLIEAVQQNARLQNAQGGMLFSQRLHDSPEILRLQARKTKIFENYNNANSSFISAKGLSSQQAQSILSNSKLNFLLDKHGDSAAVIDSKQEEVNKNILRVEEKLKTQKEQQSTLTNQLIELKGSSGTELEVKFSVLDQPIVGKEEFVIDHIDLGESKDLSPPEQNETLNFQELDFGEIDLSAINISADFEIDFDLDSIKVDDITLDGIDFGDITGESLEMFPSNKSESQKSKPTN